MSTLTDLERALKVYNKVHPKAVNVTVRQFAAWFLTHGYYSEGSSKLPCEACGMLYQQHQPRYMPKHVVSHGYCDCIEPAQRDDGRCDRCLKVVLP
jgi:hypothetical protein